MTPSALRSNPGVAAKLEQERMLKAGITAHKTGLPKKLLELFAPLPPLPHEVSICRAHSRDPGMHGSMALRMYCLCPWWSSS